MKKPNPTSIAIDPNEVDIRLATGHPLPATDQPVKLICTKHMSRIGMVDDTGSLAVYDHNIHCYGCGFHIKRRYAALAFLLGLWDGEGSEDSDKVRRIVRAMQPRLKEFVGKHQPAQISTFVPPPISLYDVEAFHQYMLRYRRDRMEDELIRRRGLSLATIRRWKLGYTGTHFTIPVPDLETGYLTIRYRADELALKADGADFRKYEGTWGRNTPVLYPLRILREVCGVGKQGQTHIDELWVVEGEFDSLSAIQAGDLAVTVTNGASNIAKVVEMVAALGIKVDKWVVATDADAAGEQAAQKIIAQTKGASGRGTTVRARWGMGKDLTDYYSVGGSRSDIWFE